MNPCPALWILRGAMGRHTSGPRRGQYRVPQCQPDRAGRCGHCHTTIKPKGTRNG